MNDTKTQKEKQSTSKQKAAADGGADNETKEAKKTKEKTENRTSDKKKAKPTDSKDKKGKKKKNKKKNRRRKKKRGRRRRSEYDQEILDVRRVTRVIAGGRRFSFSVTAAVGNHQGEVGVGVGKAGDIADAIGKAMDRAKKNRVTITRTEDGSVAYNVEAKYGGSVVHIRPAPGRGVVAGSSVREVLRLAGIKDVSGKLISRTKNKLNNARATIKALQKLEKK